MVGKAPGEGEMREQGKKGRQAQSSYVLGMWVGHTFLNQDRLCEMQPRFPLGFRPALSPR